MIHSRFTLADDCEAGVEVDPRRLTRDHLAALREVGFNRGSLGVQDNDPVVQRPCTAFSRSKCPNKS
jgi:oxygen-independent coproporphyrinogen-3 oxidase